MKYSPILCSIHDQYLAWATQRAVVVVQYEDDAGNVRTCTDIIADVFTDKLSAEWMVMGNGERIRLDRIRSASAKT